HIVKSSIDEYTVLLNWYQDCVHSVTLMATLAFSAVAASFFIFDVKTVHAQAPSVGVWIWSGWLALACSGLLGGLNTIIAFLWMSGIAKTHAPALIGTVTTRVRFNPITLGILGWSFAIAQSAGVLAGFFCLIRAAALIRQKKPA